MTQLLEKVFAEAGKLSEVEQNALAKWMLKELSSEKRWDKVFAESETALEKLADEALAEHKKKTTRLLDPESL
jgi:hypothetical protein